MADMYERYIMTTDPDRFPVERIREYVDYLHEHNQHYIVMVDPAMAYQTEREKGLPYETFLRARDHGLLLQKNGSIYQGVVWPGVYYPLNILTSLTYCRRHCIPRLVPSWRTKVLDGRVR
jgi:alpha-glucosidase (family GH31 glycosyl hydrolase)